jgi:hypothetical protein
MFGLATPTLGSWSSMIIQVSTRTQTQYGGGGGGGAAAIAIGKGCRSRSSFGNCNKCRGFFSSSSSSSSVKTAVAAVDSDHLSSSNSADKVSSSTHPASYMYG